MFNANIPQFGVFLCQDSEALGTKDCKLLSKLKAWSEQVLRLHELAIIIYFSFQDETFCLRQIAFGNETQLKIAIYGLPPSCVVKNLLSYIDQTWQALVKNKFVSGNSIGTEWFQNLSHTYCHLIILITPTEVSTRRGHIALARPKSGAPDCQKLPSRKRRFVLLIGSEA